MSPTLNPLSFPLHGSRLIEASAGTGKTYTLAALYVRLVLNHGGENAFGRSLLPPDILVVTFTEAATRELRDRIRARLAGSARCFRASENADPDDKFLNDLLQAYSPQEHPHCADLLDAAAQWMDEAAIYTIHGFCNRMLKQHAFDSGSLFNLELSQAEKLLQTEATQDYWRTFCYNLNHDQAAQFYDTPDELLKAVRPLLSNPAVFTETNSTKTDSTGKETAGQKGADPATIMAAIHAEQARLLAALKTKWRDWIQTLTLAFESAWESGQLSRKKPSTEKKIREWLGLIESWSEAEGTAPCKLTGTAKENLKPENLRTHGTPGEHLDNLTQHPALAALGELLDPKALLPQLAPELLIHAGAWISARIEQHKRRQAVIGFNDMLTRLGDALADPEQGPGLARLIREQYPIALIDEFQDTDPTQYQIFECLYASQPDTGWFMIGDPKQAIYAFRGADIHTYLQARNFTQGRHYTLGTNFRSARPLVDAVNHLFEQADAYQSGAFLMEDGIRFNPVNALDKDERFEILGEDESGLTLWQLASDNDDDPSIAKGAYTSCMAAITASEIVRLLDLAAAGKAGLRKNGQLRPLRPADIAILVRTGTEAAEVRQALRQRSVRSVYLSDKDSVLSSPEGADMLRWLKACTQPEAEHLVRAALGTPTLAQSWQALDRLCSDEQHWEDTVEQFRSYQRTWQRRGVLPMLRNLMHDYNVPQRLLAENDERTLTNLLHLAELLQTAAAGQDGEQALLRWFSNALAEAGDGSDEQIMRLESDADLIKVCTIHKSKGLEYPLVFLPFICVFREVDKKDSPVRYHSDNGELCLSLVPTEAIRQQADQERLAEDLRLLYVALTRARHHCWAGMAPMRVGNGKNRTDLHKSAMGYLLAGGRKIAPQALGELLQPFGATPGIRLADAPDASTKPLTPPAELPAEEQARHYNGPAPEQWWIASYSALQPQAQEKNKTGQEPTNARDEKIRTETDSDPDQTFNPDLEAGIHGFDRGPIPGTFLHGLLEQAAKTGFDDALGNGPDSLDRVIEKRCRPGSWPEKWCSILQEWMSDFVSTPLPLGDARVTLCTLAPGKYRPELEFMLQSSQVNSAELDRLVTSHVLPGLPRPELSPTIMHGMLKGFIDLALEYKGRYYVADYKSTWLGNSDSAYSQAVMEQAMLAKRLDVQISLYLLALHRLLRSRLGDTYDFDSHIGGGALVFLRGLHHDSRGVTFQPPNRQLIEALDALFAQIPGDISPRPMEKKTHA